MMKVEYKIKLFDIPEFVTCQICNREFKRISFSHIKKHGLSMKAYRLKFPNAFLECCSTRLKRSEIKKEYYEKHNHNITFGKDFHKKYSKLLINKNIREKANLHNSLIQNLPEVKEKRSKIAKEKWNNPDYYKKNIGIFLKIRGEIDRDYFSKCISEQNKERWANPEYKKNHSGKNHPMYGLHHNDLTKEKISKGRTEYYDKLRGKKRDELILKIKELLELGLTQQQVADKLNIQQGTISCWVGNVKRDLFFRKNSTVDW